MVTWPSGPGCTVMPPSTLTWTVDTVPTKVRLTSLDWTTIPEAADTAPAPMKARVTMTATPMTTRWAADRLPVTFISSRLQKLKHGQNPSVILVIRGQIELQEDVGDVLLHCADRHHQGLGDGPVGLALRPSAS